MTKNKNIKKAAMAALSAVVVITSIFAFGFDGAEAASGPPNAKGVVNTYDGAIVRASYSTSSSNKGALSYKSSVTITNEKFTSKTSSASTNRWYYASTPRGTGYIRADLINITLSSATAKTTDYVNLRNGAGTSFGIITTVPTNASVTVYLTASAADGSSWYKVKYGNSTGYVSASYVTFGSGSSGGSGGSGSGGSESGGSTGSGSVAGTKAPDGSGLVNVTDGAIVRSSYSTSSSSRGGLSYKTKVTLMNEKFTSKTSTSSTTRWYYTNSSKGKGYIRSDLITPTLSAVQAKTTDSVNLRQGAGTSFGIVKTIPEGEKIDVQLTAYAADGSSWYKVKYGSYTGYLSVAYITFDVNGSTEPETPPAGGGTDEPSGGGTQPPSDTYKPPTASGYISDSDGVYVRKSYSTSSASIGSLAYKANVTVNYEKFVTANSAAATNIWYNTKSSAGEGFIRSDLVKVASSTASGLTTGDINIRAGAGSSFNVLNSVPKDTTLEVILQAYAADGTLWYKVKYGDTVGYATAGYITITSESSPSGGESGSGSEGTDISGMTDAQFKAFLQDQGFPESYITPLMSLHAKHPNWVFTAKNITGYTWNQAVSKQCSNYKANLITKSGFPESFRAVQKGTYDFNSQSYIGLDSSAWVAASGAAVKYYMDPRNWLTEDSVFMFEANTYSEFQTESAVADVLSSTALPSSAAATYISAGKKYNVSPIYMAAKTKSELGGSSFMIDGHSFTYGGKSYSGCYNVFNIGASDSANGSAATKGLVYAYNQGWNSLNKAINGGAKFISANYLSANQYTSYYERFNVLNGLGSIGTYQYATSIFYAATEGSIMADKYKDLGLFSTPLAFEIPVYKSMPSSASARPSSTGNNISQLQNLTVSTGGSSSSSGGTATTAPNATGKVNVTDGAILRSSYSTSSAYKNVLSYNTPVTIASEKFTSNTSNGSTTKWYYNTSSKGTGYIRSDLITASLSSVPAKTTDYLNLRTGASTSFPILTTIPRGAAVNVYLKAYAVNGDLWYKIKYGTTTGYSSSDYITFTGTNGSTAGGVALSPAFDPLTNTYTATVPSSVNSVTVGADKISGGTAVSGTGKINLSKGVNTVNVTCKSSSGLYSTTYVLKITRK